MAGPVPEEQMMRYRRTAAQRALLKAAECRTRRAHALTVARGAADLLKRRFGAKQVFLFGSLASGRVFDARSDIDLAVSGMTGALYYRALAALLDLDPAYAVDLVMMESAPEGLLHRIRLEGRPL